MKKLAPLVALIALAWLALHFAPPAARDAIHAFGRKLMLPLRVARLHAAAPDRELPMPVAGVRVDRIADTWGAARSGDRRHEGQDIFAARGTEVRSATAGYVARVGSDDLGGKVVFVVGAGGRRYYYAHLEAHAPDLSIGDEVTTDTLLGYVGTTGNARGTPPHLHFGIYANGGALDPLPLLIDRPDAAELATKAKPVQTSRTRNPATRDRK